MLSLLKRGRGSTSLCIDSLITSTEYSMGVFLRTGFCCLTNVQRKQLLCVSWLLPKRKQLRAFFSSAISNQQKGITTSRKQPVDRPDSNNAKNKGDTTQTHDAHMCFSLSFLSVFSFAQVWCARSCPRRAGRRCRCFWTRTCLRTGPLRWTRAW